MVIQFKLLTMTLEIFLIYLKLLIQFFKNGIINISSIVFRFLRRVVEEALNYLFTVIIIFYYIFIFDFVDGKS